MALSFALAGFLTTRLEVKGMLNTYVNFNAAANQ